MRVFVTGATGSYMFRSRPRTHRRRSSGASGRNPLADFLDWRTPKQPGVLTAELRRACIADTTAHGSDISSLVSQDASCLLETKLLLILQRAHARYLAKPLVKTRGAHACLPCEVIDSKRLVKVPPEPHDGSGNPLGLALRLSQAVQHSAALLEQHAEQNLPFDHRCEHRDLHRRPQQADEAQDRIEQSRRGRRYVKPALGPAVWRSLQARFLNQWRNSHRIEAQSQAEARFGGGRVQNAR